MENETAISVKNIGKKYNIAHQQGGYVSLRDVLTNILKSPFAFLKQKAKKVAGIAKNEEFWALRNVSFEVKKGEVIGVIGRNGAGKSTLLKILSQITPPTEGEIRINGRIGSLLEVGTGFHPELSGRENIFLNGAILGMTRQEIAEKFDAIVAFSGIEKFLDTPVKRYSSGMYVRLAFSVAAHMDPDILIIDEVLAVGDAEFQKKCLGKMDEITKKEGRTIIFVSHNMQAIQQLCDKCVLLENGQVKMIDDTKKVIDCYLRTTERTTANNNVEGKYIKQMKILDPNTQGQLSLISVGQDVMFEIKCFADEELDYFSIGIQNSLGVRVLTINNHQTPNSLRGNIGHFVVNCTIKDLNLSPGHYSVCAAVGTWFGGIVNKEFIDPILFFDINDIGFFETGAQFLSGQGFIMKKSHWQTKIDHQ